MIIITSHYYLLVYILARNTLIHEYNNIEQQNAAGVVVDAEAVAFVTGQGASHPTAGSGQRWKDNADEETRVRGRVAHNAHAGFQH